MKRTIVSLVAVATSSLAACSGAQDAPASSDTSSQSAVSASSASSEPSASSASPASSESASPSSSQSSAAPSVSDDQAGPADLPDTLDVDELSDGAEPISYRMVMEVSSPDGNLKRVSGEVVANPASPGGHDVHMITELTGSQTFEIMSIGEDYYVKAPTPIDGKTWIKGPIPPGTGDFGLDLNGITGMLGSNSLTKVGAEDGLVKYETAGFHVWVDGDGRLAKIESKNSDVETAVTFSDWNGDFTITPPPASEVFEQ